MSNNNDNKDTPADLTSVAPSGPKSDSELLDALKNVQKRHVDTTVTPIVAPVQPTADAHPETGDVVQPLQAAQLSHKAETVAALVGGQSPKPPGTQSKRKSNKFTFRGDDDLLYAISEYAIAAGVDESEAARRLIEAGLGKSHIVITPKSPPELLEFFAGALKTWSRDFAVIKSRLNAPMPTTNDEELIALVTKWRSIAVDLQALVPTLIQSAQAVAEILTSLNAQKIELLRNLHPQMVKWVASREATLAKEGLPEAEIASNKSMLESYRAIKSLIEDLGIIKPKE